MNMEAGSSRMCLRKRPSTDSVDSARMFHLSPGPSSQECQELGRTRLDLPESCGRSWFYLATQATGRGGGNLRHYLSGLHALERRYREIELLMVAGKKVKGWPHDAVSCCLQRHLGDITSFAECRLELRVTDHAGQRHLVEIQFEVLYEDGVGDKARAAFDVIVRVIDNVICQPDVTDVTFQRCSYIRIRHGALCDRFVRVGDDHTLRLEVPGSPADYVFKCYMFYGHNQTASRRRGRGRRPGRCAGGDGSDEGAGSWPQLCVLQEPKTCRYVMVSVWSHRLMADHDKQLATSIENIQKPDPRFFILHQSGDGDCHQFCLRPLILSNYYLRYDALDGLKLTRCDCPPQQDPDHVRSFAFQFLPVDTAR